MAWIAALIGAGVSYYGAQDDDDRARNAAQTNVYNEQNPWGPTVPGRTQGIWAAGNLFNQYFGRPTMPGGSVGGGQGPKEPSTPNPSPPPQQNRPWWNPYQEWQPGDPTPYGGQYDDSPYGAGNPGGPGGGGSGAGNFDPLGGPGRGPEPRRDTSDFNGPRGTFTGDVQGYNQGGQFSDLSTFDPGQMGGWNGPQGMDYSVSRPGGGNYSQFAPPRLGQGGGQQAVQGGGKKPGGGGGGGGGGAFNQDNSQRAWDEMWRMQQQGDPSMQAGQDFLAGMLGGGGAHNPYAQQTFGQLSGFKGGDLTQMVSGGEAGKYASGGYSSDPRLDEAYARMSSYEGSDALNQYIQARMGGIVPGGQQEGGAGGGGPRPTRSVTYGYQKGDGGAGGGGGVGGGGQPKGGYHDYITQLLGGQYLGAGNDNPYLNEMIEMQQRGLNENYLSNIAPQISASAEASGRYGSGAHQIRDAQALQDLNQQQGDMRSQIGYQNYGDERNRMMQALGYGTQLQMNELDNETSQRNASAAAGASARSAQMQAELAREGMLLDAMQMQQQGQQFGMSGQMAGAQFGMEMDRDRTGQLMNFALGQDQNSLNALGLQTDLSKNYSNDMSMALGLIPQYRQQQFGEMNALLGGANDMSSIAAQDAASRRSASVSRQGMNQQQQQAQQQQQFQREMAQFGADTDWQQMLFGAAREDETATRDWERQQMEWNFNAPWQMLGNYGDLLNSFGSGGGTGHQWGQGQYTAGPSPITQAVAGGIGAYTMANDRNKRLMGY